MIEAILLAGGLVVVTGLIHYQVLTVDHRRLMRSNWPLGRSLLTALLTVMAAHMVEVAVYSAGYQLGQTWQLGSFAPASPLNWMESTYFSLVTYTSLGLGDIFPQGHLRLIAGVEALNGFLLISCSASLLFVLMHSDNANS